MTDKPYIEVVRTKSKPSIKPPPAPPPADTAHIRDEIASLLRSLQPYQSFVVHHVPAAEADKLIASIKAKRKIKVSTKSERISETEVRYYIAEPPKKNTTGGRG